MARDATCLLWSVVEGLRGCEGVQQRCYFVDVGQSRDGRVMIGWSEVLRKEAV